MVNGIYRSISTLESVDKFKFSKLTIRFKAFWELKSAEYDFYINIPQLIIVYNIVPYESEIKGTKLVNLSKITENNDSIFNKKSMYGVYTLPTTMDFFY